VIVQEVGGFTWVRRVVGGRVAHRATVTPGGGHPSALPYRYVEARGRVVRTVRGAEARAHIDELSRRCTGEDGNPIRSERVICTVAVDRVHKMGL
jgi:hypothetical protein